MADEALLKFEVEVDGVPAQALVFVGFRAEERLSDTGSVELDLVCARLDPAELLGRSASLHLRYADSPERHFHGIVWSAELEPLDSTAHMLKLELRPRLAQLALGRDSRVFTDRSIVDVVGEVLAQAGLAGDDAVDWQAQAGPVHPCILQYDESDYDFIRRLLFEEGIGFLIQNDPDCERVVFFDTREALLPVDGIQALVDRRRQDVRHDTAFQLRERVAACPDSVMLRDYNLKDPAGSPEVDEAIGDAPSRQVYAHPGGHLELDTRATRTLERLRGRELRFEGGSYWPHLEAGRTLELESDLRTGLQQKVILLSVEHEGQLGPGRQPAGYVNRFTAMPHSLQYRPEQAPAPPSMGTQRGFITGAGGQELHGDDYGRVKLRFAWDRSGVADDKASQWMRVGQLPMPGSMVVPRVGFEVLLGSEFGDLDRPYITGHLYNEEAPAPYGTDQLTTNSLQSASTDGGAGANELRMDSSSGAEQMLMNASYDMTVRVENSASETVAKHATQDVGVNSSLAVTADYTGNVAAGRSLSVGAMQTLNVGGDYNDGVGGDHNVTVGAARNVMVKGDQVENVGGSLTRSIGSAQTVTTSGPFERKVVGDSAVSVGGAWAETIADSKNSTVSGSRADTVAALKLIDAKSVGISVDGGYAETVDSQSVKTGEDRTDASNDKLTLDAKGGLSIKAKDINFVADDKLTFSAGGVTITLAKAGEVKVKAKEITIKNSKAFKQITHKTN